MRVLKPYLRVKSQNAPRDGMPRWEELAERLATSLCYYEQQGCPNLAADCREIIERCRERAEKGGGVAHRPGERGREEIDDAERDRGTCTE